MSTPVPPSSPPGPADAGYLPRSAPAGSATSGTHLSPTPATDDPLGGTYMHPATPAAAPGDARVPFDVGDVSVGDLIGNVTRDLTTLIRQELALAQAELKQEVSKTAKAAGALGAAGVAGFFVVLFLSLALWAGLSNLMDPGWAGLIVAALWAVIGAVLYASGRATLRRVNPTPERTVESLSHVPDALKGSRGGNP